MHESIFSGKVSLSTQSSLVTAKVDIVKYETTVEVRLIDTTNIFSLYVCTISQSDYYVLKREQDLLVDYEKFINILVSLFHSLATGRLSGFFDDSKLRFIENGEFRNICKLELKFSKPDETHYRRYLGDLLSRMESDNIKLIKENSILRDKCAGGDRELREKIRYLETELRESRRRLELSNRDYASLEAKEAQKTDEINRLNGKIFSLENENSEMKSELEKYRRENAKSYKEQLAERETELRELKAEIETANELIKKMKREVSELKDYKLKYSTELQKEKDRADDLQSQVQSLNKKFKVLEEKYKALKDELRNKGKRIKELEAECSTLRRNLDNTRFVNNFLYEQKIGDNLDNFSDSLNLRPEPPSPTK